MDNKINTLFNETIQELSDKSRLDSDDPSYNYILNQLEFVYDCLKSEKDIFKELQGRELDFPSVASNNFSSSDDKLLEKIGEITVFLSKI